MTSIEALEQIENIIDEKAWDEHKKVVYMHRHKYLHEKAYHKMRYDLLMSVVREIENFKKSIIEK